MMKARMTPLLCLFIIISSPTSSYAQTLENEPDEGDEAGIWELTLGVDGVYETKTEGADIYQFVPKLYFDVTYKNRFFISSDDGVGLYLLRNGERELGLSIKRGDDRQEDDDPLLLEGLPEIKKDFAPTMFFSQEFDGFLEFGAEITYDFGGARGFLVDFSASQLFSLLYLKYGVTSVRDTGQSEKSVAVLASKLNSQQLVGPRMYSCGPVIDGDPPGWAFSQVAKTAAEGRQLVKTLAEQGVDCIKVYNEISKPVYEAIRLEAAKHEIPVIGHVPHSVDFADIVELEVQHLTGVPYIDGGRPVYGRDYSDTDINALDQNDFANALTIAKANNISFTPTLSNYQKRLIASDSQRFPATDGMKHLPEFWNMAFQTVAWHPNDQDEIDSRILAVETSKKFVKAAHEQGIDILAGTDTIMPYVVPGESLLIELEILAELFESNDDALISATRLNGEYIDKNKIGVLQAGAYADILVLKSSPRENLDIIRDWNYLVAGGRLISRTDFDKEMSKFDKHFQGPWYRTIMGMAMSLKASDYSKEKMDDEL